MVNPNSASILGPLACLTTATLWAISVHLFRSPIETFGARSVNLLKCSLAALLQGFTVLLLGQVNHLFTAPTTSLLWIAASGIVGLTIGDTALFAAVARLGVQRTLLLQTLAPIFVAITAGLFLDEQLSSQTILGGIVILAGVATVVFPSRGSNAQAWHPKGILLAVLAALGQAVGLVMAKQGMHDVAIMPASFLRLLSAALGLIIMGALTGRLQQLYTIFSDRRVLTRIAPATFLGTYLALFLMMVGIAWSPASIGAVLLSTAPVFSLFLERVFLGQAITARGLIGTMLAIVGIAVVSGG